MTDSSIPYPSPLGIDAALDQLGRLRRLARSLGADAATAEDAAQETLRRALEQPEDRRSDRSWLDGVLRNVLRFGGRTAVRRRARERAAAKPEATPTTLESLARAELYRALTAAVAELPGPVQQCVMLRYVDELPPRAIASRLGLPRRRVYKLLEQGRVLLRERLVRAGVVSESAESRLRWSGLGGLVWLKSRWTPAVATRWGLCTGVLMTKAWLAGCVGVGVVVAAAWLWAGEPEQTPAVMSAPRAAPEVGAAAPIALSPDAAGQREAVADEQPAPDRARAGEYEFALDLHVADRDDLPAEFGRVWVAPVGQSLNALDTGPDGIARLRFRGHRRELELVYGLGGFNSGPVLLRRVRLAAGQKRAVALKSEFGRVVSSPTSGGTFLLSVGNFSDRGGVFQAVPDMVSEDGGRRRFVVPVGRAPAEQRSAFSGGRLVQTIKHDAAVGSFVDTWSVKSGGTKTKLTGIVQTASGRPAAKAVVVAWPVEQAGRVQGGGATDAAPGVDDAAFFSHEGPTVARTDAEGRYSMTLPPGGYDVRAGGGDFGRAEVRQVVAETGDSVWSPRLQRGAEFGGVLRDAAGPMAGWTVQIEGLDGQPYVDRTTVEDDGRFAVPNVPCAQCRVMVRPPKGCMWIVLSRAAPVATGVSLTVPSPLGTIVAWARAPAGEPDSAEFRIWSSTTGLGLRFPRSVKAIEASQLPLDGYRVVAAGESLRFGQPAFVTLSAGQPDVEVGDLPIESAARVTFGGLNDWPKQDGKRAKSLRLERSLDGVTSTATVSMPEGDQLPVLLPFGDWAVIGAERFERTVTRSEPIDWPLGGVTAPK